MGAREFKSCFTCTNFTCNSTMIIEREHGIDRAVFTEELLCDIAESSDDDHTRHTVIEAFMMGGHKCPMHNTIDDNGEMETEDEGVIRRVFGVNYDYTTGEDDE